MIMIDVNDVVQYLYCPRKVYFMKLGIKTTRPKMEMGKEVHREIYAKLRRKKRWKNVEGADIEIIENVYLESERYGIKGYVDLILKAGEELLPVDIKYTKFRDIFYGWKMQIVAYGVLIEENFNCLVRRGFIYLVDSKDWIEVEVLPEDRKALERIVNRVRKIIASEEFPTVSKSKKCNYCEMSKLCH